MLAQPVVSALTGQQTGRSRQEPGELAESREGEFSRLDRMTLFVHFNRPTGTYSAKLPLVDEPARSAPAPNRVTPSKRGQDE